MALLNIDWALTVQWVRIASSARDSTNAALRSHGRTMLDNEYA